MKRIILSTLALLVPLALFAANEPTDLTEQEKQELQQIVEAVQNGKKEVQTGQQNPLDLKQKKYWATDKKKSQKRQRGNSVVERPAHQAGQQILPGQIQSHLQLKKGQKPGKDVLQEQAQVKSTAQYQKWVCKNFLKKKFPKINCNEQTGEKPKEARAAVEANDEVTALTDSWLATTAKSLDKIPASGKTDIPIWSDDYWKIQTGVTSFRYGEENNQFDSYGDYLDVYKGKDYVQPAAFLKLGKVPLTYAPSEKYDVAVGDHRRFTLTLEQRAEADANVNPETHDVEAWMGICHGWAPAAFMVPPAVKPVTVKGANEVAVKFYPSDIRALASLQWANGSSETNFVGGRCNVKGDQIRRYKNGRAADQDCFDNNPGTFHLALGNLVGIAKKSFVMDRTFDYEVWNQPIHSYSFTYFNPLKASQTSKDWSKVAVNYDAAFKAADRFQGDGTRNNPSTRGSRDISGRYDDRKVKKVVGVHATVVYGAEVFPFHGDEPSEDSLVRMNLTYDLELDANGNVTGGEWYNNNHTDFLWVPRKGSVATNSFDRQVPVIELNDTQLATDVVARAAAGASRSGSPLCQVVARLVNESTDTGTTYECR